MWQALKLVSTGLALMAFLIAAALTAYRRYLRQQELTLSAIPPEDRLRAYEKQLDAVAVDTTGLTPTQRYDLARRLIDQRARRLRHGLTTVIAIFTIAAAAAVIAVVFEPHSNSETATFETLEADAIGTLRLGRVANETLIWSATPLLHVATLKNGTFDISRVTVQAKAEQIGTAPFGMDTHLLLLESEEHLARRGTTTGSWWDLDALIKTLDGTPGERLHVASILPGGDDPDPILVWSFNKDKEFPGRLVVQRTQAIRIGPNGLFIQVVVWSAGAESRQITLKNLRVRIEGLFRPQRRRPS